MRVMEILCWRLGRSWKSWIDRGQGLKMQNLSYNAGWRSVSEESCFNWKIYGVLEIAMQRSVAQESLVYWRRLAKDWIRKAGQMSMAPQNTPAMQTQWTESMGTASGHIGTPGSWSKSSLKRSRRIFWDHFKSTTEGQISRECETAPMFYTISVVVPV